VLTLQTCPSGCGYHQINVFRHYARIFIIGLVRLGYCLGRGQHTRKNLLHNVDNITHVVVRHWNTIGSTVETFPNGLCRKPKPLLKFEAHFGQLRHSLSGGVLKRNKKTVCVCGSPLKTSPMFINNIPLRLKVIPYSCSTLCDTPR